MQFQQFKPNQSPSSAPRIGDVQTTFTVQPSNCSYKFLIDTGSVISLLPLNTVNLNAENSPNTTLFAANGSQIKTAGKQNLDININGKTYSWTFIIANVTNPILGADFLTHFNLVVDCKNKKIYNLENKANINLDSTKSSRIGTINILNESETHIKNIKTYNPLNKSKTNLHNTTNLYNKPKTTNIYNRIKKTVKTRTFYNSGKYINRQILTLNDYIIKQNNCSQIKKIEDKKITTLNPKINTILSKYPEITQKINTTETKLKVEHAIITNGLPTHAKTRQLTPEKFEAAKKIFNELLETKIIAPSKSNWSSALMMKKKANGEWRCCGDYRQLNANIIRDS